MPKILVAEEADAAHATPVGANGKTPGANGQNKEKQKEAAAQKPADIEKIKEEAFARGRKSGRQEVEKQLHTSAQALASALEQISDMRASLLRKCREDMVRLVMGVARQVIRSEAGENEQVILATVTRALEAAVSSDEYHIRVNPADMDVVAENEPLFFAAMKSLRNIHFVADETIQRGGCIAESRAGDVDATIESQLEEIHAHLRAEILKESEPVNG